MADPSVSPETIHLGLFRDEYDLLVYSLSMAVGQAAQQVGYPWFVGRYSSEQRHFQLLLGLQSKLLAWGGYLTKRLRHRVAARPVGARDGSVSVERQRRCPTGGGLGRVLLLEFAQDVLAYIFPRRAPDRARQLQSFDLAAAHQTHGRAFAYAKNHRHFLRAQQLDDVH